MTRQSEETAVAVARLTQDGFAYKDRDPEEAIQKFQVAYQKSRLLEDDEVERTCAFNLGAAFVGMNQAKEGLKYLHKAIPPENENSDSSNGDLFFNMGIAFEQLEEDSNALKYYEKAHEEFRLKGGMKHALEMHCLQKCLNLQQKLKRFNDSAKVYKQMAAINSAKGDCLGQADCLSKMAIQYQKAKRFEVATAAAMESLNVFNEFTPEGKECFPAARVLNELGLLYTQVQYYQEALQCFERALEQVNAADGEDPQLLVVIKQNLGAAYNFLGDFQRAIKFHEEAIEHYAKLKYRNGQGQCFTNLAFALSQLVPPELKDAEVAFHHALRASKDTGDINMRWQVLEGLGAVNFNQDNFEDAIRYFQDALQCVGQNNGASERIKAKLRLVTEFNVGQRGKPSTPGTLGAPATLTTQLYVNRPDMMLATEKSPRLGTIKEGNIVPQKVPMTSEMPMMSRTEQQVVVADSPQRRIVGIRRKDSHGPIMQRVARGLTTMSTMSSYTPGRSPSLGLQVDVDTTEDYSKSDSSGSSSGASSDDTGSSSSEEEEEEAGEVITKERTSGLQSERVKEIFAPRQMAPLSSSMAYQEPTYQNVPENAAPDPATQYQMALQAREAQEEESESSSSSGDSSSESDSSSEEDSSEEDEEETDTQKKQASPHPPPTKSPPQTSVNTQDLATYVAPKSSNAGLNASRRFSNRTKANIGFSRDTESSEENPYASIDQTTRSQLQTTKEGNLNAQEQAQTPSRPKSGRVGTRRRVRSSNFFDSEDESKETKSKSLSSEHEASDSESNSSSSRGESSSSDDESTGAPVEQHEPRGQQEARLYQEHQRLRQEQEYPSGDVTQQGPPLPPRGNEKESKTCVVM